MNNSLKNKLARSFYSAGISADGLTFAGLGLAFAAGWLIYAGRFGFAAAVLIASGLLDLLDGEVARVSKKAGVFGGILDSTLDRYGDAFVFFGALFYYAAAGRIGYSLLAAAALTGSFAISYVRARAECEMESCRVGFWERGERIGCMGAGLIADNLALALWLLAIGTQMTAMRRLFLAACSGKPSAVDFRRRPLYAIQVISIILALAFFKLH